MKTRAVAGQAAGVSKALMIAALVLGAACGAGPPEEELDRVLGDVLERTRNLADRAAHFDHDQVLRDIGVDPANGMLYRLDDHLGEATHEPAGMASADLQPVLAVVDLEGGRSQRGGIVAYRLDLPIRDIGALELQVISSLGGRLDVELRGELTREVITIDLLAVGDGLVHTYRLELAEEFALWSGDRLTGLRFRASDQHGTGLFEVRSAAFLSLSAPYVSMPFGISHRRQGRETRRSIFQWSSSSLRFPVEIERPLEAVLEFGTAALVTETAVRVEVVLDHEGERRRLISTTLQEGAGWTDRWIPLGELRAGEYIVELRVTADEPNAVFWSNPALVKAPERRFNVILVLEDALRADHLSCYGYDRLTSPVKDAFARRGLRFARCYAQATKTRFSCPSFMTSLYPTATGVEGIWNPHSSLHENYITLAEVLRRRGFVTASIHQNPNAGSPVGLDQGFSYLFENVPGRAEDLYTGKAARWIEEHGNRNFFLYLHLADPHEPYDPPEGFRAWFDVLEQETGGEAPTKPVDRRDPRWMLEARRALYDGEISANDSWFAAFLKRLDELELAEDTLIVFMSDHGEHLGEHDLWSHNPPSYVQVLHTPLIMVYPRSLPAGVVAGEIVQNLDIMPTILELAGVDGSDLLIQGESLLPLIVEGSPKGWRNLAYAEEALLKKSREDPRPYGSAFFDRWHLLDSLYAPMKLFDLDLDPAETRPLRTSSALRGRIRAHFRNMQLAELEIWRGVTGGEGAAVTLDPETIDELKALGYLE